MDDGHPVVQIIVFIILLLIDAVFAGSDVVLSSLSEADLEKKTEAGDKRAGRLLDVIRRPSAFLGTMHFIEACVCLVTGAFVARPWFYWMTMTLRVYTGMAYTPAVILGYVIVCLILLLIITVFGIVFPKRIASNHTKGWIRLFMPPVYAISVICRPFVGLVSLISAGLMRLFRINPGNTEENVTEEEIIMMVSEGHEQGVIEESEARMISNIFEFDDKEVADIMTHRRHIVSIPAELTVSEAAAVMARERFSRYPVYEEDEDILTGIVHLKDVMRLIVNGEGDKKIKDIMRRPLFVPDTQNIDALFSEMQAKKIHMAVVVDEYGQTCGIVAMEDILEEIVGNIQDEYDQEESYIRQIGGAYLMKGLTPLEMIHDQLGIEFEDDFDTLNGYLIYRLDRIPRQSESASVDIGGYTFRIISVRDNAISLVKVTKITDSQENPVEQHNNG